MEMEIIKLLNEFEKEKTKQDVRFWNYYQNGFHYLEDGQSYSELLMISKKYEFIKRLVDNDKIDLDKTGYKKADFQEVWNGDWRTVRGYEMLLMLLSISENPIDDLISYLK